MRYILFTLFMLTAIAARSETSMPVDQQWSLDLAMANKTSSHSILFPPSSTLSRQAKLEWGLQYSNWESQWVLFHEANTSGQDTSKSLLKELFWQGERAGWDWMVGKRVLSFGVGYARRPLDIFQTNERNAVSLQVNEGIGLISASRFSGSGEFSIMWVDAGIGSLARKHPQSGIAMRWYQLSDETEWQLLTYHDNKRGFTVGGSWVRTQGEHLEFHAEWRYQQHYQPWQHSPQKQTSQQMEPNAPINNWQSPLEQVDQAKGWEALAGLTWANSQGHNVIAEYWYDSRAWHNNQWTDLFELAERQLHSGPPAAPLRYANGQAFLVENQHRHNLLLHWHLDNTDWNPSADIVYTPEDKGVIFTAAVARELDQHWTLGASLRYFGGSSQSVYAQLPSRRVFTLNMEFLF